MTEHPEFWALLPRAVGSGGLRAREVKSQREASSTAEADAKEKTSKAQARKWRAAMELPLAERKLLRSD